MPDQPDDNPYDAIVDAASNPAPSRRSPPAWKLDQAKTQVGDWYKQQFGQDLPIHVYGLDAGHKRMGYTYHDAMDIGLSPNDPKGQALVSYLRSNGLPFSAHTGASRNAAGIVTSTGPHIHIGPPGSTHRTGPATISTTNPYDAIVAAAGQKRGDQSSPYDSVVDAATPKVDEAPVVADSGPAQPNDMEFGGMSPAEKQAYGQAQARPNAIDDFSQLAVQGMAAQRQAAQQQAQIIRRRVQPKPNPWGAGPIGAGLDSSTVAMQPVAQPSGMGDVRLAESRDAEKVKRGQGMGNFRQIQNQLENKPQPNLRQLDDPETARILRIQQQVNAEQTPDERQMQRAPGTADARILDPKLTENEEVLRRLSEEKDQEAQAAKQTAWEQANAAEIASQTAQYRKDIQASGMSKWLTELQGKGAAQLAEFGAGAAKTVGATQAANTLRIRAVAAAQAAQAESADRTEASKLTQDILGGFAGSAPELLLMQAGVPPIATFAAGSGLRATGMDRPVLPAITQGALQGAAFEIPTGGPGVRGALSKAGKVGLATAGVDLATGQPVKQAIQSGATNALMIGVPEVIGARGLKRGENEAQTQSNITPQPESAQPANVVAGDSVPRTNEGSGDASKGVTLPEGTAGISEPVRHVDLQPRRVRGEAAGQFKKETKAEAEARRAQVTASQPAESASTPPVEAAPVTASTPDVSQVSREAGAKEPWQMTRAEYAKQSGDVQQSPAELRTVQPKSYQTEVSLDREPSTSEATHRDAVEAAFKRGENVPPEVLKDYPWLAAREAIKPYVESLRGLSDKELKAEAKKTANDLNAWANNTPGMVDGRVNPELGKQAGFEVSEKMHAVDREIEARKAKSAEPVSPTQVEAKPRQVIVTKYAPLDRSLSSDVWEVEGKQMNGSDAGMAIKRLTQQGVKVAVRSAPESDMKPQTPPPSNRFPVQTKQGEMTAQIEKSDKDVTITITNRQGHQVGETTLNPGRGGQWSASYLFVDGKFRRQGIATAMYDLAESQGLSVRRTENPSPDAEAFWRNRNNKTSGAAAAEQLRNAQRTVDELTQAEANARYEAKHPSHSPAKQAEFVKQAARLKSQKEAAIARLNEGQVEAKPTPSEPASVKTESPVKAEAAPQTKQPWEMTKAEWDKERAAIRPETFGSSPAKASVAGEVGRSAALKRLLYGVHDEASAKLNAATKGKLDLSPDDVEELQSTLNTPTQHRHVIEKALSEGKPVPENVLADYPDLAKKFAPQTKEAAEMRDFVARRRAETVASLAEHGIKEGDSVRYEGQMFGVPDIAEGKVKINDNGSIDIGEKKTFTEKTFPDLRKVSEKSAAPTKVEILKRNNQAGAVDVDLLTLGVRPFAKDVAQKGRAAMAGTREISDGIQSLLAPPSRSEQAQQTSRIVRANAAQMARAHDIADKSLSGAQKFFAKQKPGANYDFIDKMERGQAQSDPKTQKFADTFRQMLDERRDQIRALGTGKLESFIEDYFPHIWEDPKKAKDAFAQAAAKRPFEGRKSFLKQRTLPYTSDGLALGLKPVSNNPVDLAVLKLREMDKYLMAHQVMNEMKSQDTLKFFKSSERLPDGWKQIDDRVSNVFSRGEKGELILRGRYAAPEPAAKIVNNYLSPGLDATAFRVPFRAWRATSNLLNQFQLGFSAFHAGFTTVDAMVSKTAAGLEDIARGKPIRGLATIASTPISPITNLIRGSRMMREWYSPGTQGSEIGQLVKSMEEAGGRARMDQFYSNQAAKKFMDTLRQGNLLGAAIRAPGAAVETLARPIMEELVPRQKMGIFADLAKRELERLGPDASEAQRRHVMAKAWDSVDNRMGQMVYDNLFWNKTLKDLSMASVRSVGWNIGTIREIGGGLTDLATAPKRAVVNMRKNRAGQFVADPVFTHRMAYVAALPLVVGAMGAMTQYLLTGKRPDELKDYFFPKTGALDENGNPERIAFPSYMKDIFHAKEEPGKVISNKLHPLAGLIAEMWRNEDYYGTKIRNEDDPIVQQLKDAAKHVGEAALPFAVRGYQKEQERGGSIIKRLVPFVGITPAPSYINKSPAEKLMSEKTEATLPRGARTRQAADMSQLRSQLRQKARNGQDVTSDIAANIKQGKLKPDDAQDILRDAKQTPLQLRYKHLPLKDALDVWDVMTKPERDDVKDILAEKAKSVENLPENEQEDVKQRMEKIGLKPSNAIRPIKPVAEPRKIRPVKSPSNYAFQ